MAKSKAKSKKDAKKKGKNGKAKLASTADKYDLYQRSVQTPANEVNMIRRVYKHAYGDVPTILREDFCGTAAVAAEWARKNPEGVAYGVDLDPEPLAWGTEHNLSKLKPAARERVHLVQGDVRTAKTPKADVLAAQNFSFFIFKTRQELLSYFKSAYKNLASEGVFLLDMLGGPSLQEDEQVEKKKVDDFTYYWEQETFNPISHDALFHIHFSFKDGSRLDKAFSYDWRIWTLPEVKDLLHEAGFKDVVVYWEGSDEDGEGNGVFKRTEKAPADNCWLAYVCGVK